MERRYLVATLAMVVTFAVFSQGFRTLERVSLLYGKNAASDLRAKCNSDASRLMGKIRTRLHPGNAEEAQLLAEMNLPIAMAQVQAAEQIARRNEAAAECARATALREAQRARREAERSLRQAQKMRDKVARSNSSAMPIAWEAADIDRRVRAQTAAIAQRVAAQTVSLQMVAEQVQEASDAAAEAADSAQPAQDSSSNRASSEVHCSATQSRESPTVQSLRARGRVIVHQVQQSFGYR
jgi:predicted membrane-bound mannosyltransferase